MSATLHKDLRTGTSVWMGQRLRLASQPRLARDIRCDVLVVGAGISGCMVAEALSDQKLDVVMVDRRKPISGSTSASTALLQYEIDTPLTKLSRTIGKDRAQRIWRRSRLALDSLRERARYLGFAAESQNHDSLYLEGDELDATALEEEAKARREAGFQVAFLSRAAVRETYGIKGRAGLLGFDNMAADPRRLAAAFLRTAIARGVQCHADTEVTKIIPGTASVEALTADGPVIRAKHLIYATGYELPVGVPSKGHSIVSTFALATVPQQRPSWPTGCFIWEASDPYLYMRPGPDGCVICGGEDEDFADEESRDALLSGKTKAISRKLAKLMPWLDVTPAYAWCGSFGASETGAPSIGAVPRMPNCYAVLGYGGNGITFSVMAAQILATTLTGGVDPDADLFSFTRSF